MNIISCSGGNDSVALIQFAANRMLTDVHVAYTNTGWAIDWWPDRMAKVKALAESYGFAFVQIDSEGMENLVRRKMAWPANKPKFCTAELKILPFLAWLNSIDQEREATVLVGIRRSESAERANWPEYVDESPNHEGRPLWSPLVTLTDQQRDDLLAQAGFAPLPYRSKECFPCVNANRADLRMLAKDPGRIQRIENLEAEMGPNKTMFRPHRFLGASGIRQVIKWASSSPGKVDLHTMGFGCDAGFCGD